MRRSVQTLIATGLLLPLAGCFVETKKGANGNENVAISTPLGGMSVKTDNDAVQAKLGLPLYPGAIPEKKSDKDSSSADVNIGFGNFHLRVLAMGFTSADSPDKVRDFYRKALTKYSDVIECHDKKPVGTLVQTRLGLTCTDDGNSHGKTKVNDNPSNNEIELKAGSSSHQHVVAFEPRNGGTKFGLVALELPSGSDNDSQETAN
jgi:hypothetical protein